MALVDFGNIGELSKPAVALVNRVAEGVTGFARPWQIKRIAYAEGQAAIISAEAGAKVSEIEQRAFQRITYEEVRNQESIESITTKAIPHLKDSAEPNAISKDWIAYFFEHCKLVTDDVMREHWARILAQEANKPSSISRRAIAIMSQLEKKDAIDFSILKKYAALIDDKYHSLIWTSGGDSTPYVGLDFGKLLNLASCGLINYDGANTHGVGDFSSNKVIYFDHQYCLGKPLEGLQISCGFVMLTSVGEQLLVLCEAEKSEEFLQLLLTNLYQEGAQPYSELTRRNMHES